MARSPPSFSLPLFLVSSEEVNFARFALVKSPRVRNFASLILLFLTSISSVNLNWNPLLPFVEAVFLPAVASILHHFRNVRTIISLLLTVCLHGGQGFDSLSELLNSLLPPLTGLFATLPPPFPGIFFLSSLILLILLSASYIDESSRPSLSPMTYLSSYS